MEDILLKDVKGFFLKPETVNRNLKYENLRFKDIVSGNVVNGNIHLRWRIPGAKLEPWRKY